MTFRPPIAAVRRQRDPNNLASKSQDGVRGNLLLTTLRSQDASLAGKQSYDLTKRAVQPDRTWVVQNLLETTLKSQDAQVVGEQSFALPQRPQPAGPTWTQNLVLTTLRGQDASLVGDQYSDRPPPAKPAGLTWAQNLLETTLGIITLPPGAQLFDRPAFDPRPQRSWAASYNLNLIGQDASLVGDQSFALPARPPALGSTWVQNLLTTTLGFVFPPGEQWYDRPPQGPALPQRSWAWSYNLNLLGQDASLVGEQSFALPARPPALGPTWVQNLLGSTLAFVPLPPGAQLFDRPAQPPWFRPAIQLRPSLGDGSAPPPEDLPPGSQYFDRPTPLNFYRTWTSYLVPFDLDTFFGEPGQVPTYLQSLPPAGPPPQRFWAQNLLETTLGIVPIFPPGDQLFDRPVLDSRSQRSWVWNYNLNLIGKDAALVGDQYFDRPPPARPAGPTWTQNLLETTLFPVQFPSGRQFYDRPLFDPRPQSRTWIWSYNLNLIGKDAKLIGGQFYDRPMVIARPSLWLPQNLLATTLGIIPLPPPPGRQLYVRTEPRRITVSWALNLLQTTLAPTGAQTISSPAAPWHWVGNAINVRFAISPPTAPWNWNPQAPNVVREHRRTRPNGRWRSVIDPSSASSLPDLNRLSPFVTEVGFTLFFNTTAGQSLAVDQMTLVFVKPSGEMLSVPSDQFFTGIDPIAGDLILQHNYVGYTFGVGDLDEPGWWNVYLERFGVRCSGVGRFFVASQVTFS